MTSEKSGSDWRGSGSSSFAFQSLLEMVANNLNTTCSSAYDTNFESVANEFESVYG